MSDDDRHGFAAARQERHTNAVREQAAATDRLAKEQGREADAHTRQAAALERIAAVLESLLPTTPPATKENNDAAE